MPQSDMRLRVPATANPYLAGMKPGAKARAGDKAPQQSPLLVPVSMKGVTAITVVGSGSMEHLVGCPPRCTPPEGSSVVRHRGGAEHGIGDVAAPINSLVGVFLSDAAPDKTPAPAPLDFSDRGRDFLTLTPQLKQVFFIGSGSVRQGIARRFVVPRGATRFYLGSMDAYEWNNNTGSFSVLLSFERSDVKSNVSFADWACLPDRTPCTPERPVVEKKGPGQYHVILRRRWNGR